MFAYCLNNPVKYGDHRGTDAVVLYDEDNAGHIGIMVQDEDGTWWHFYWGPKSGKGFGFRVFISFFFVNVESESWCVEFSGDASSLDSINAANQYAGDYEALHYFDGDFCDAVDSMNNISEKYNLQGNNCSQVSLRILATANKHYYDLFIEAARYTRPRKASEYIIDNRSAYDRNDMIVPPRNTAKV